MDRAQMIHAYLFTPEIIDSDDNLWDSILVKAGPLLERALAESPSIQVKELGFEPDECENAEEINFNATLAENVEYFSMESKLALETLANSYSE